MASPKLVFVFLFLALLSSFQIEARDSQMFNKIPTKTNELEKQIPLNKEPENNPKEQQPNFVPDNEQSYGLYAHESLNLPQPSVTPNNNNNNVDDNFPNNAKYLPKNYNPVAYVTQPEDFHDDSTFSKKAYNNNNNYENNEANNYYNAQQQQNGRNFDFMDTEDDDSSTTNNKNYNKYYSAQQQQNGKNFDFMDTEDDDSSTTNNRNYNNYYKGNDGNNNYNNRFMDASFTTNPSSSNNNNNNNKYNRFGGRVNRVQPQGMSDTRFLENGRYYYDINSEEYSVHPNDNAMAMRNQYHPRGTTYGNHNNANSYHYNNFNDAQYQDDDNMP